MRISLVHVMSWLATFQRGAYVHRDAGTLDLFLASVFRDPGLDFPALAAALRARVLHSLRSLLPRLISSDNTASPQVFGFALFARTGWWRPSRWCCYLDRGTWPEGFHYLGNMLPLNRSEVAA
ncbi:hypothetical protein [Thiorhodovibrio winogradskyi]|uniref:hypothetical protein n=1 Tax=Thiorhodovibrio winogradskyi TaxID=77007 RepID=UPI002E2AE383|nr:hypothetical protein [Thiorhodovibrio winogradskyi]